MSDLAARLRVDSSFLRKQYREQGGGSCYVGCDCIACDCDAAADALDAAEAERDTLRDEVKAANADADILARQVNAAQPIVSAARAYLCAEVHESWCPAICGPRGETWTESDRCQCARAALVAAVEAK